jgi:hypothetical protein
MRMRRVCSACYRHVCPCGWYKVLSRRFNGVMACGRCESAERVTVREVAHYNAGMDDECGYRNVLPTARHACQFCERVRDEVLMDFVSGEGWECKDARRCEAAQHGTELDVFVEDAA